MDYNFKAQTTWGDLVFGKQHIRQTHARTMNVSKTIDNGIKASPYPASS